MTENTGNFEARMKQWAKQHPQLGERFPQYKPEDPSTGKVSPIASETIEHPIKLIVKEGGHSAEDQAENDRRIIASGLFADKKTLETPTQPVKSKRKLSLKVAGTAVLAVATAFGAGYASNHEIFGNGPTPSGETNPDSTPKSTPDSTTASTPDSKAESTNINVVLGKEQTFIEQMIGYMSYGPDGPITYWTAKDGTRRYLITGGDMNPSKGEVGNSTHLLITDGTQTLENIMASGQINGSSFKEVFAYDPSVEYRKYYAGITSVLQFDKSNPDHLWGTVHGENRADRNSGGTYTASVGLVESLDGGLTWIDHGAIIHGDVNWAPGKDVTGAGQPTSILGKDGYAYIMYVDWARPQKDYHPDQIYLARMKANDDGTLGPVEYWNTDNKFDTNFDPSKINPVIPLSDSIPNAVYMALPEVSWNQDLNEYICVGESAQGFWISDSQDLIHWSSPELIYNYDQYGSRNHSWEIDPNTGKPVIDPATGEPKADPLKPGEKWDSYPTFLSEQYPSSSITGTNGIFYHADGDQATAPHEPAALNFTLK